jgi:hypothetical protein
VCHLREDSGLSMGVEARYGFKLKDSVRTVSRERGARFGESPMWVTGNLGPIAWNG